MKSFYQILELEDFAAVESVKKAYRKLAQLYHPDRNQNSKVAEIKFKEIAEAYQVLSSTISKNKYDDELKAYRSKYQNPLNEQAIRDYYDNLYHEKYRKVALEYARLQRDKKDDKTYFKTILICLAVLALLFNVLYFIDQYKDRKKILKEYETEASPLTIQHYRLQSIPNTGMYNVELATKWESGSIYYQLDFNMTNTDVLQSIVSANPNAKIILTFYDNEYFIEHKSDIPLTSLMLKNDQSRQSSGYACQYSEKMDLIEYRKLFACELAWNFKE